MPSIWASTNTRAAAMLAALGIAGCADMQGAMPNFPQILTGVPGQTTPATTFTPDMALPGDYVSFFNTELVGFFEQHPSSGAAGWPRVAITLVDAPDWHLQAAHYQGTAKHVPGPGCWKFKAKIWDGPKKPRDIPVFYFCTPKDKIKYMLGGDEVAFFDVWSGMDAGNFQIPGTTGTARTEGPNPPNTPLPNSPAYRHANFSDTWSGIVIEQIVFNTAIDFKASDARLWVNLDPKLAPAATVY